MVKINKDIIIDGTNKTLGDLANSSSSNNYLPITGGTLTGDLRIKGSNNYGNKLNLGDGDYVHLYEIEDDVLEIKASEIRLNADDVKVNGNNIPMITYRDVSITGISSIASKSYAYVEFDIPTISGYTPIAISLLNANGGANGFCVYTARLQNPSFFTVFNAGGSTATPTNLRVRIVYLKN